MTEPLRCISLWQPWASFVAEGVKTIETRGYATKVRGRIGIASTKSQPAWPAQVGDWSIGRNLACAGRRMIDLPHGRLVATAELVDCVPIVEWGADPQCAHITIGQDGRLRSYEFLDGVLPLTWRKREPYDVTDQLPYGVYTPGRYAWLLADIKATHLRCPACWRGPRARAIPPSCPVCAGFGSVGPIPVKGKQGWWWWNP